MTNNCSNCGSLALFYKLPIVVQIPFLSIVGIIIWTIFFGSLGIGFYKFNRNIMRPNLNWSTHEDMSVSCDYDKKYDSFEFYGLCPLFGFLCVGIIFVGCGLLFGFGTGIMTIFWCAMDYYKKLQLQHNLFISDGQ